MIGGYRRQIGWVENLSTVAIGLALILRRTVVKRIHVARQLFQEPVSGRQPAAEILHETLKPFVALDACGLFGAIRQWWGDRQPEMDEQGKSLA